MAKRTMRQFIREFRKEITKAIIALHPELKALKSFNDDERRVMVLNEPELKNFAKTKGVVFA
jgi:hypothetical protein